MIHSFTCKNFHSFADETTIDFVVNNNAPKNNGYFKTKSGKRLSKVATVVGANASGKTNLLKVLPFFKWLVVNSFERDPEDRTKSKLPIMPFQFTKNIQQKVELAVTFEISGKVYTYSFSLTQERILAESLRLTEFAKQKKSSKTLFKRAWNKKLKRYELSDDNFHLPKVFKDSLREDASIISTATRFNHKESKAIANFWRKIYSNVTQTGWMGDSPNSMQQFVEALSFYAENEALKKEAEALLARFDLGLSGLDVKKEQEGNKTSLQAKSTHSIEGEDYSFSLIYESSGTKQLLTILRLVLSTLDEGGFAVVDEFDASMHPRMVLALFKLFAQPETNPKNAQLLFSTHNHQILNQLDKYQIVLVEKGEDGISDAWHLDEMEGVSVHENHSAKYAAGAYGATPDIF